MTTAPPPTKPSTLPPMTIPDKLPGLDDPFWKPYREEKTPQTAPSTPGGPGEGKPPGKKTGGK